MTTVRYADITIASSSGPRWNVDQLADGTSLSDLTRLNLHCVR